MPFRTRLMAHFIPGMVLLGALGAPAYAAQTGGVIHYLELSKPSKIEWPAQSWEGDQQPHTLSVVEFNREGYKYWGWYGLNQGRGMGLARSQDLIHWTKFDGNPIWTNARWPSVLRGLDAQQRPILYF